MISKPPTIEDVYEFDYFMSTPGVREGLMQRQVDGDKSLLIEETDDGPGLYYQTPYGEQFPLGRVQPPAIEELSMDGMQLAAGPSQTMSDAGGGVAEIKPIPRNNFQQAIGKLGEMIQAGADKIDFDVVGFPGVGTLTLKDLTVGDLGKVLQDISFGFYPVEGGNAATGGIGTFRPKADATLELLNAAPAVGAATKAGAKGAVKAGKAAMKGMK